MKNEKNPYAGLLFWAGIGALAFLYLNKKEETQAQSIDSNTIVKENLKYNPIFNKAEFGGNPFATNQRGSGKFNYLGFLQAKHAFGLECYSASVVNIFKSLGIIEPNMSRRRFELTYTNLHLASDAPSEYKKSLKKSKYRIPSTFNDSLRGMYKLSKGQIELSPAGFAVVAQKISEVSDYALHTGMRGKDFVAVSIKKDDIEKYLLAGYVVRIYTKKDTGHYVVSTGIKEIKDNAGNIEKVILTDDTWYGANYEYKFEETYSPWIIKAT
ncbi:MAG TPA: hypothetical protein PLM36_25630 [Leptospiraceae bacterium]|nr:hypothetical protein [Leptospiraceae bacterium]HMY34446.1 hypothetical protein [Leptospiraceae bacterium]HNK55603.1 hypothetical protein [Leptospiraceae bacterium]HNK93413.1 hypothetical protein [Leptospiraceae bacterium]HNM90206.1 hypothetical protein [Leptospiraceae bacterium]